MKQFYLYPLWIRLWHWTNALLFIILIISGTRLHFAVGNEFLAFESAILVHNVAGIMLALAWLVFFIGNFVTENGKHYRLRFKGLIGRLIRQSHYYAIGIFRGDPHPFHVSAELKFNTLQQLSYIGVMYGLMPILIASGLFFWGTMGNLWLIAITHLVVAYLLVLFMVAHIYIITTGETVFSNLRAMLTGWHKEKDYE